MYYVLAKSSFIFARSADPSSGCVQVMNDLIRFDAGERLIKKSPRGCDDGMSLFVGAPTGVRTPVSALRGPRPGPLDDGGSGEHSTIHEVHRQR